MIKLSKVRIKYLRTDRGGKETIFYSEQEVGEVIEETAFHGLIDKVLEIEGVPDEVHSSGEDVNER